MSDGGHPIELADVTEREVGPVGPLLRETFHGVVDRLPAYEVDVPLVPGGRAAAGEPGHGLALRGLEPVPDVDDRDLLGGVVSQGQDGSGCRWARADDK